MHTGLIYLPIAVGALHVLAALRPPGRPLRRARPLLASGVLITAATVLLTFLTATTPVWALLVIFAVFGIGFSMVNAPITNAAVSGMPTRPGRCGSAVASTSRQVGVSHRRGAVRFDRRLGAVASPGTDFAAAARPLWFVCVGTRRGRSRCWHSFDVATGDQVGRAAGAADRRARRTRGGGRRVG